MTSSIATASGCFFDMDLHEGTQLWKNVLIRNAFKASSSSFRLRGKNGSIRDYIRCQTNQNGIDAEQDFKDRWMIMAARSGLHPSDYPQALYEYEDEEDDDDEVILLPQYRRNDYHDTTIEIEDHDSHRTGEVEVQQQEDESEWFEGLLQEVSNPPPSLHIVDAEQDDGEAQMSISSTLSLPSLIIDEDGDTSEEEEAVDEQQQGEGEEEASVEPPHHSKLPSYPIHSTHYPIF